MAELYVSDFAWGYMAAGQPVNATARRAAVARQHRAEAALQDANDDRQHLWEKLNQLAAHATALEAENAALRQHSANLHQENANLRQHAADLQAWGRGVQDDLAEARRTVEEIVRDNLRRCLAEQGG